MDAINRSGSPMHLFEEDLSEAKDKSEKRRRDVRNRSRTKSPFLVGSIDQVNKKIAKLDKKLSNYTQLVCETRSTENEDDYLIKLLAPSSAKGREKHDKKVKENREMNAFAGFYAIQNTLGHHVSDRVKNISKISMKPSKTIVKKQDTSGTPKFVELHQYPGYDPSELTPLPQDITAVEILTKVSNAQVDLRRKPQYKPEFERLFYSPMGQAILQDIFWWYFLEKFQSNKSAQMKLFNRVSFNYVKLMIYARDPQYKEVFLKSYPDLMAQAVYAAYCESFPDSYRQFNDDFKEQLVALIAEWMAGIKPSPRSWLRWNFPMLEPPGIKNREAIMNAKNDKKNSVLNFDYLEQLDPTNMSVYSSTTSLASKTSRTSFPKKSTSWSKPKKASSETKSQTSETTNLIDTVADAQSNTDSTSTALSAPRPRRGGKPFVKSKLLQEPSDPVEALSPIREMYIEEEEDEDLKVKGKKRGHYQQSQTTLSFTTFGSRKRESHPACRGPDFVKYAFNVNGQSPLVAHFMRMKRLQDESGTTYRVQRTEMENLPALDAKTYDDVIKESLKTVRQTKVTYEKMFEKTMKQNSKLVFSQKRELAKHLRREKALLSKPAEVKRLSDLLILEARKDADSISAGADAAIHAALLAQDHAN